MPFALLATAVALAADVVVATPVVPAAGSASSLVRVPSFGRYAVTAESSQGTAVQVVSRATGPGPLAGTPGEQNGRLDTFLDRGEYKVVAVSDPAGTGSARLDVRPFVEQNDPPVSLRALQPVETTLADLQQRTWWIEGGVRVDVEMAGRSLADLRVWREGTWLVDATPECVVESAAPGRALRRCTLSVAVEDGPVALVAYGGPALPWASSSAEQPLHVRLGIPRVGEAGRARRVISALGVDRVVIPRPTERVALALAAPGDASVMVRPFADDPFGGGSAARVTRESLPPVTGLTTGSGADRVVTVRGEPGTAYTLAWFPLARTTLEVKRDGEYFLSTVPSLPPGDQVDASLVVAAIAAGVPPVATSLVGVGPDRVWERRFNLLATTSVFLDVTVDGTYEVALEGVSARFRVEPLWVRPPDGWVEPPLRAPGRVELSAGYYRLTLVPDTAGIVTAVVRPGGWSDRLKGAVGIQTLRPEPLRGGATVPALRLTRGAYPLLKNSQPGVDTGIVLRSLPMDLDDAVPLWLGQEPQTLATVANGPRRVEVVAEDGRPCELSVDGGPFVVGRAEVQAGRHVIVVRHAGTEPVFVSVGTRPPELDRSAALPPAPPVALPDFPVLAVDAPQFGEVGGEAMVTYGVRVDRAALLRVESTGLLATSGALRTRTVTNLIDASVNGVGRNFLLQTWLGEGDYQLQVTAVPPSAGHFGVQLLPVSFRDGGRLAAGTAARAGLSAGEGLAYTITVTEAGTYSLRSYGPGQEFRYRFEDADGFPVATPEASGPQSWWLTPGVYRVVLLPERFPSRRITEWTREAAPVARNGHGPHDLALGTPVAHTWWETEPRLPDVWRVEVPAPVQATLEVDAEMVATLFLGEVAVARTVPGETWSGPLVAGSYRIEATNARRSSGVDYQLGLGSEELVAGQSRAVTAPTRVPVSVGTAGIYAFGSRGDRDVRATLLRDGVVVAVADDRPEDWNFAIRAPLSPGAYTLQVDPVGSSSASVVVSMDAPSERAGPALSLGRGVDVTPGADAVVFPLEVPAGGLLIANATSAENLGISLEHLVGSSWRTEGGGAGRAAQVIARLGGAPGRWRVRVWSMDGRGQSATVRADVVQPLRTTESALRAGFGVGPVKASRPSVGVAVVRADRGGLFAIETTAGTSWCPYADRACEPLPSNQVPATLGELWLVREAAAGGTFRGRRVIVGAEPGPVAAAAAEGVVDLGRGVGATVVFAQGGVLVDAGGAGGRWDLGSTLWEDGSVAVSLAPDLASVRVRSRAPELRPVAEGRMWTRRVPLPDVEPMGTARVDGVVAPGTARRLHLPTGTGAVRVVVAEGAVAARVEGVRVGSVLVGPGEATIGGPGADVVVIATGSAPAAFVVDTLGAGPAAVVTPESPRFEAGPGAGGTLHVDVRASGYVHVRGATSTTLVSADGRVAAGPDLAVPRDGGALVVQRGPGPLLVWVDAVPEGGPAAFGPVASAPAVGLDGAAARPLSGAQAAFEVPAGEARLVHFDLPPGALARVRVGTLDEVRVVPADGVLDVVSPGPAVRVDLRRIGGEPLSGLARVHVAPPVALAEGFGGARLFGAGDSQLYRIDVPAPRVLGLGVGGAADAFEGALFGPTGALLARGYVLQHPLAAGPHYFLVHLPGGAPPVLARPVVVGLVPPDAGPPADVVRSYLESSE